MPGVAPYYSPASNSSSSSFSSFKDGGGYNWDGHAPIAKLADDMLRRQTGTRTDRNNNTPSSSGTGSSGDDAAGDKDTVPTTSSSPFNPAWAANADSLAAIQSALRSGRPVQIDNALLPEVARDLRRELLEAPPRPWSLQVPQFNATWESVVLSPQDDAIARQTFAEAVSGIHEAFATSAKWSLSRRERLARARGGADGRGRTSAAAGSTDDTDAPASLCASAMAAVRKLKFSRPTFIFSRHHPDRAAPHRFPMTRTRSAFEFLKLPSTRAFFAALMPGISAPADVESEVALKIVAAEYQKSDHLNVHSDETYEKKKEEEEEKESCSSTDADSTNTCGGSAAASTSTSADREAGGDPFVRRLAIVIHIGTDGWAPRCGGAFVWCWPENVV